MTSLVNGSGNNQKSNSLVNRQKQANRQSRAPNQSPKKLGKPAPIMRAVNRPSTLNTAVPKAPSLTQPKPQQQSPLMQKLTQPLPAKPLSAKPAPQQSLFMQAVNAPRPPKPDPEPSLFMQAVNAPRPPKPAPQQSLFMQAVNGNTNRAVPNTSGLVQGGGRRGAGTQLAQAAGLNDASDLRIANEEARKVRIATNVAVNHGQQLAGVQGQRRQHMFGENPPQAFTGGRH